MILQTDLEGNHISSNNPAKPWTGICCEQCWNATQKRCVCSCGGAFHGMGSGRTNSKEKHPFGTALTLEQAEPFLKQMKQTKCPHCETQLKWLVILAYPHEQGWTVKGFDKKQWLFIKCPKCKTDRSLWKMGVPRQ